ncbi:MAG: MscL family protein, partial [Gluconobacter oxydans]|uniref:large conductance mechanosensitive channel protein MscL n=1 Tax=Gluconobacter oxydans TaxID=442 RepID=UPI0039EC4319
MSPFIPCNECGLDCQACDRACTDTKKRFDMSETKHTLHTPGWVSDFQKFIMRGNVLDLAVGVVIGAAFSAIVGSAVKAILPP